MIWMKKARMTLGIVLRFKDSWIRSQRSIHRKKTELHQACGSPNVNVSTLRKTLNANPIDAHVLDMEVNTTLHVIAQNGKLLLGASSITAQFFIEDLINACPGKPDAIALIRKPHTNV